MNASKLNSVNHNVMAFKPTSRNSNRKIKKGKWRLLLLAQGNGSTLTLWQFAENLICAVLVV